MAVSFSLADLPMLANLADNHPVPEDYWEWVRSHTPSNELQEIAVELRDAWSAFGHTPQGIALLNAEAIQELQAALPTIRVSSHLETRDAVGEAEVEFLPAS
jgi:hypothetical protein